MKHTIPPTKEEMQREIEILAKEVGYGFDRVKLGGLVLTYRKEHGLNDWLNNYLKREEII